MRSEKEIKIAIGQMLVGTALLAKAQESYPKVDMALEKITGRPFHSNGNDRFKVEQAVMEALMWALGCVREPQDLTSIRCSDLAMKAAGLGGIIKHATFETFEAAADDVITNIGAHENELQKNADKKIKEAVKIATKLADQCEHEINANKDNSKRHNNEEERTNTEYYIPSLEI